MEQLKHDGRIIVDVVGHVTTLKTRHGGGESEATLRGRVRDDKRCVVIWWS